VVLLFIMVVGLSYLTSLARVTCHVSSSLAATLNQNQELGTVLANVYAWRRDVISAQRWQMLLLSTTTTKVLLIEVPTSHLCTHSNQNYVMMG
jgi:hypothetical protein